MEVKSTPPPPLKTPNPIISFSDLDFKVIDQNLHNPMVISVIVGNYIVRKVLVNQGSSADILYGSTLQQMQIPKSNLSLYNRDLVGFFGEWANVLGVIEPRTTFRTELNIKTIDVRCSMIDSQAPYHMILERPSLNILKAVVSTPIWH